MTILTEGKHAGGFLVSEANGNRSREEVTINASQTLVAGHVVAELTAGGWVEYDNVGTDGSEAAAGILLDGVTTGAGETAKAVVIIRDAEVNLDELTWFAAADQAAIDAGVADLLAKGIVARSGV